MKYLAVFYLISFAYANEFNLQTLQETITVVNRAPAGQNEHSKIKTDHEDEVIVEMSNKVGNILRPNLLGE